MCLSKEKKCYDFTLKSLQKEIGRQINRLYLCVELHKGIFRALSNIYDETLSGK